VRRVSSEFGVESAATADDERPQGFDVALGETGNGNSEAGKDRLGIDYAKARFREKTFTPGVNDAKLFSAVADAEENKKGWVKINLCNICQHLYGHPHKPLG